MSSSPSSAIIDIIRAHHRHSCDHCGEWDGTHLIPRPDEVKFVTEIQRETDISCGWDCQGGDWYIRRWSFDYHSDDKLTAQQSFLTSLLSHKLPSNYETTVKRLIEQITSEQESRRPNI